MSSMWENIREFDKGFRIGGRAIIVFLCESIYFIVALCGDYQEPVYMAQITACMAMGLLLLYLSTLVVWEGEHLRTVYEKLRYFPVDRKKYLLGKSILSLALLGFQAAVTILVFLLRFCMQRGVETETMVLILVSMTVSGIVYLIGSLILMVTGERALTLFPLPIILGIAFVYIICC